MAIYLYRDGDTHTVRGHKCKMGKFTIEGYKSALNNGWRTTPESKAPTKEEADTNNSGKLSSEEVREAAKAAGIEGYYKKRINTLKKELGYDH